MAILTLASLASPAGLGWGVARGASPGPSASPSPEPVDAGPVALPTPAFEWELPRRRTTAGPWFVGPATLELEGTAGRYRWQPVAFGAGEVELEANLDPADEACRARVRTSEADHVVTDAWLTSDAGHPLRTALVVDHATRELRLDSDCAAWSLRLTPIDDPELPLFLEERSYPVRAASIDELRAETQHVRGRWAAFTRWHTSWQYDLVEDVAGCRVENGRARVDAVITFPAWRRPAEVDPRVAADWDRFAAALRIHELGHVTIALQGAGAIDDWLDRGVEAATCDMAQDEADAAASAIMDRYDRRNARYDEETEHGRTQGTWFR